MVIDGEFELWIVSKYRKTKMQNQNTQQPSRPQRWPGQSAGVRQPEPSEIRLSSAEVKHGIKIGEIKKAAT